MMALAAILVLTAVLSVLAAFHAARRGLGPTEQRALTTVHVA